MEILCARHGFLEAMLKAVLLNPPQMEGNNLWVTVSYFILKPRINDGKIAYVKHIFC